MVIVARIVTAMPGSSIAEPAARANVVVICKECLSVPQPHIRPEE